MPVFTTCFDDSWHTFIDSSAGRTKPNRFSAEPAGVDDCFLTDNDINQLLNNQETTKEQNLSLIVFLALAWRIV